jgi:hypothetical protein
MQTNFIVILIFCYAEIYYSTVYLTGPGTNNMIHKLEELLSHTKLLCLRSQWYTKLTYSCSVIDTKKIHSI